MSQDERKDDSGGMNHPELGELDPVDVRTVWSHEALDFTPWLSENLQRLSDKFLAQDSVGVYLTGNHGEEPEDYLPKIEPHVEALRRALDDDGLKAAGRYPCETTLPVDDARDPSNWDRMADWLDDRRRTYGQVLQAGASR